jgi:hypothetical protein
MIDFSDVGTIQLHQIKETQCVQFLPHEGKTVEDMLQVLDAGLARMNDDSDVQKRRGILLNQIKYKAKQLPIPCVFIFEEEQE